MSLILEALRKSEAERRRGQAPGLFSSEPVPPEPVAHERTRMLPIAVVIAVLAMLGYGSWRWQQASSGPDTTTPAGIAETAPGAAPNPGAPPAARAETAPAPAAPVPTPTPAEATIDTRIDTAPAEPPITTRPAPTPSPPTAAAVIAPTTIAPVPGADSTGTEAPALPLAALPAERRRQLPALKLSMHVYAEDPARRFAIIDGQRIIEGSSLAGATVQGIRRDGVLLDIDGTGYLLPRP